MATNTVARREGSNTDYRGNNILNLGLGPLAIPDLAEYLHGLDTRVGQGSAYGFWLAPAQRNIILGAFSNTNTFLESVFPDGTFSLDSIIGNTIDLGFERNKIGSVFANNDIGPYVTDCEFKYGFQDNKVGYGLTNGKFDSNCYRNEVNSQCADIEFGTNCRENIIGTASYNVKLGTYVRNCEVSSDSGYIEIGSYCENVKLIGCGGQYNAPFVVPDGSADVTYINNVLTADPYGVGGKLDKAENLADLQDATVARQNLGLTDGNGKLIPGLFPGGIDDIQEFDAGVSAFPAVGEKGVIYVDTSLDANGTDRKYVQYRWSGSAYGPIPLGAGSTDALPEGVNNKYFTAARVIGTLLTGYAKAAATRAIAATDSVLVAFSLLEKKADDNAASISGIGAVIPSNASLSNKVATASEISAITGLIPSNASGTNKLVVANSILPIVTNYTDQDVVTIVHNRGRFVFVQVYEFDGYGTNAEIFQVDMNTVRVSFSKASSGNVVLI
jgi:hypothetical protein